MTLWQELWKAFLVSNNLVLEPFVGRLLARAFGRRFFLIIMLFWSLSLWGPLARASGRHFLLIIILFWSLYWGDLWPEPLEGFLVDNNLVPEPLLG